MAIKRPRIILLITALLLCTVTTALGTETAGKITVFGSSVASGSAAENNHGYWFMLKDCLQERGWDVSSCSRGGDRTTRILDRFDDLLSHDPDYVFIGLSLANEGIFNQNRSEKDAVYRQFKWGMQSLIALVRSNGMTPVVGLCYPNADYTDEEYAYVQRMNLLINSWDVPSANFLGAVDDGRGRWADGFEQDPWHPNTAGHREMFYAIVPSLFDALEAGKSIPQKADGNGFLTLEPKHPASVRFTVDDTMHSWAMVFSIRTKQDGVLAVIEGKTQQAEISIHDGGITYRSITSKTAINDGQWHCVALSHRYAQKKTQLYVDGRLIATVDEQIEPRSFALTGNHAAQVDFKEWLIYRAALNDLEVQALFDGRLLQASLELYAPLEDVSFTTGKPVENRAQSLSQATFVSKTSQQPEPEPTSRTE